MASGGTYSFIAGRVLNLQAGSKMVGLLCDPPSAPPVGEARRKATWAPARQARNGINLLD